MSEENKKWYKLVFKQNQPIHIGKVNWGVINETEIFIPGWTMWGALTNAYLRESGFKNEEEVEKKFEVITNFFPSFDGETILEPNYRDGEFHLGDFSESEFRLYFVDTTLKTSIEPILRKAKDEHLYEFDYILPAPKKEFEEIVRKKGFKNVLYWVGLIALTEIEGNFLKSRLKIWVGGDRRYGFGELEVKEVVSIEKEKLENEIIQKRKDLDSGFRELKFIKDEMVKSSKNEGTDKIVDAASAVVASMNQKLQTTLTELNAVKKALEDERGRRKNST